MSESMHESARIINNIPGRDLDIKKIPIHTHSILDRAKGEKLYIMDKFVGVESTDAKVEKVVFQGTEEQTIQPTKKLFILRTGARSSCDASLLLEVTGDGTAHAAVTHWGAGALGRRAHTDTVSSFIRKKSKGERFSVLVSSTIKDLQQAERTDLYEKMIEWNNGRKPDLVYIPFEGIDVSKIGGGTLYQLVLQAKTENGVQHFEVSVPGTTYSISFTPQSLGEDRDQVVILVKF